MRSCRNCTNATHREWGGITLYCKALRTKVAPAISKNTEENKAQNQRLINIANTCGAYEEEPS